MAPGGVTTARKIRACSARPSGCITSQTFAVPRAAEMWSFFGTAPGLRLYSELHSDSTMRNIRLNHNEKSFCLRYSRTLCMISESVRGGLHRYMCVVHKSSAAVVLDLRRWEICERLFFYLVLDVKAIDSA